MSQYRSYSDEELVHLLVMDDDVAYLEIYDRYAGLLYTHARKKLHCREEAKDLVQELFTTFWKNREGLNVHTKLSNYLYTAVRYRVINHLARKNLQAQYANSREDWPQYETRQTDYSIREQQLQKLIEKEVNALPKKMREIFLMSRQLHLSHKKIASELNLSESTVKKQVNNALKVLRVKLRPLLSFLLVFFI